MFYMFYIVSDIFYMFCMNSDMSFMFCMVSDMSYMLCIVTDISYIFCMVNDMPCSAQWLSGPTFSALGVLLYVFYKVKVMSYPALVGYDD
jgi:hypothetical protein